MIDNQVRHQVNILPQIFDICPTSQAWIDPCVIDRIKAGIRAVNRIIEWENMNPAEQPDEWSLYQAMQCLNISPSQAICISNQLYFVIHGLASGTSVALVVRKIMYWFVPHCCFWQTHYSSFYRSLNQCYDDLTLEHQEEDDGGQEDQYRASA